MRNPLAARVPRAVRLVPLVVLFLVSSNPLGALPKPLNEKSHIGGATAAERYRRLGDTALARGDWRRARVAYEKSLDLNPGLAGALIGLAKVARSEGEDAAAERHLQEALSLHPNDPRVELAWGRYLFLIKRFDEAEKVLRRALRHPSARIKAYLNLADLYLLGKEQLHRAVESFRAAIAIGPDHAGAHYGLGETLLRLKRFEEGERALITAGELAPRNPLPFDTLGQLYTLQSRYDKALWAFAQSIRAQPHHVRAYFLRGAIYFQQGRYDDALAEFLAVLKIEPENALAHLRCGFVYERQQRFEDARRAFKRTIELDPKQAVAYNNLAWMAALAGSNLDQALTWSKRSLELSPNTPSFLDTLGWLHRARGELGRATVALEKAVAAAESPPAEILYHLGVVYQETGRNNDAAMFLERALDKDGSFVHHEDARSRLEELTADSVRTTEVASGGRS